MDSVQLVMSILAGIIIGAVCGMILLILGIMRKELLLGILGMVLCLVCGVVAVAVLNMMFLTVIPAAIMTGVIYLTTNNK